MTKKANSQFLRRENFGEDGGNCLKNNELIAKCRRPIEGCEIALRQNRLLILAFWSPKMPSIGGEVLRIWIARVQGQNVIDQQGPIK
ncbi:hypothetical protein Q4577_08365 [Marinovum sp. 2_MG-2023]|uniref:hypothetical protein n=1 Tax=unclassified Marinovum TaxID=2647166 RepID=UPI0026E39819|nr:MULTISPECIES: hypothetical protein [unclassified Marinovum]MDO6730031.1 hypothetical protein [Marinovum sp. 2_MG-2023]MDO6779845.1 hypothetical protein [Marinovum sp. 1_MG-2023]